MWLIDPSRINDRINTLGTEGGIEPARYFVHGYINRLQHPGDLRRLAVDGLTAAVGCDRKARSHAGEPGSTKGHRCTGMRASLRRHSSGEARRSPREPDYSMQQHREQLQIDYGTVVEDSSILPNSYVGIGLDVARTRSPDGNNLLNLERDVTMEIADPCVFRQNKVSRQRGTFHRQSPSELETCRSGASRGRAATEK